MAKQWQARARSVRGASHKLSDTPNQDAEKWEVFPGGIGCAIAVADGHGDPLHARSDKGSSLAVDVAVEILRDWIKRQANASEDEVRRAAAGLPEQLLTAWRRRIADQLKANPPTREEAATLRNGLPADMQDGVLLYGSTLLAAATCEHFAVYLQIGDGDIVTVTGEQPPQRPVSGRSDLPISQTDSLCQKDALARFKHKVEFFTNSGRPDLILLATDGYANSFADDAEFLVVGRDLKRYLERDGLEWVDHNLASWLTETSERGSADDITLALAWFAATDLSPRPPKKPTAPVPWRFTAAVAILILLFAPLGWLSWRWLAAPSSQSGIAEEATLTASAPVKAIAFSPSGMLAAATDKGLDLWNANRKLLSSPNGGPAHASSLTFSADGGRLAVSFDNSILILDIATAKYAWRLPAQGGPVTSAVFSQDGTAIAYAAANAPWIWTLKENGLRFFGDPSDRITLVAFAAQGQQLVSAGDDGLIKIWKVEDRSEVRAIAAQGKVDALAVAPNGETAASGGQDHIVKLWHLDDGQLIKSFECGSAAVHAIMFSPRGGSVACASGNIVTLYNVASGRHQTLRSHAGALTSVAFSSDGAHIAAGGEGKTIEIWNVRRPAMERVQLD